MLEGKEMVSRLYDLAATFKVHMRNKAYREAKYCYDTAVRVAVFLELDEKLKDELFGIRGERGVILQEGLFPEDEVQRAYLECIKRGQTYEKETYKPMQKYSA